MSLSSKQIKYLRGLAHHRAPAVSLGARGLTPEALAEITSALAHHELLKIKIGSGDRVARHDLLEKICDYTQSEPVQEIGRMAVVYRPAAEPRIHLP